MDPRVDLLVQFQLMKRLGSMFVEAMDKADKLVAQLPDTNGQRRQSSGARRRGPRAASATANDGSSLSALEDGEEYSVKQAAHFFGLKPGTVRQHITDSILEAHKKDNGRVVITGAEIRRRRGELGLEATTA